MQTDWMAVAGQMFDDLLRGLRDGEEVYRRIRKTHTTASPIDDLDERQTATVLHALRLYQETVLYGNGNRPEGMCNSREGCDHFDGVEPLTAEEIDALCERLNYGVEQPQETITLTPLDVVRLGVIADAGEDDHSTYVVEDDDPAAQKGLRERRNTDPMAVLQEFIADVEAVGYAKTCKEWPDLSITYGKAKRLVAAQKTAADPEGTYSWEDPRTDLVLNTETGAITSSEPEPGQ